MNDKKEMLIQKYQPSWVDDFISIKEVIKKSLWEIDVKIEHVGSTAIKNLAAKPIIDIDLVYKSPESFEGIKVKLEKIGYYHNGDQGIEGREVFKRENLKRNHLLLDAINHHLYVCQTDNEELQRHLIFRNYLREDEEERKKYQEIKYDIAEKANQDRKVYAKLKETLAREFVEAVIKKAKSEKK